MTNYVDRSGFLGFFLFGIIAGFLLHLAIDITRTEPPTADTRSESMLCYELVGEEVKPEHFVHNAFISVKYVNEGAELPDGWEAMTQWVVYPDDDISFCTITIPTPTHVLGDPAMDAMGHELLHCLSGSFHD